MNIEDVISKRQEWECLICLLLNAATTLDPISLGYCFIDETIVCFDSS
jgi:hypothetical protein